MNSKTDTHGIKIEQKTEYPKNGKITVKCDADKKYIAFRIPGWCKSFTVNCDYVMKNGYAYVQLAGNDKLEIELDMFDDAVTDCKRNMKKI